MGQIPSPVPTYEMLGCTLHGLTREQLTDLVETEVLAQRLSVVANHNLHSLYCYQKDVKIQEFFQRSRYVHVDGMSVVLLGRLLGHSIERSARVTYVDWLPLLMERANERGWRLFYLGSKPGVAERGVERLTATYPRVTMAYAHGYFDFAGEENQNILERIRSFVPHLVLVGMGMPRQEHWILGNLEDLPPSVVLPCGAAIDYFAGAIRTPPRWAGRWGLEWLFRLFAEPGRLWRRYLVEPWLLSALLVLRWLQQEPHGKEPSL